MYDTILVATDGSEAAQVAVEHAIDLAAAIDGEVHVLTVVDPGNNPLRFGITEIQALDRRAEELVDEIVNALDDPPAPVQGAVRRGRPAQTIVETAAAMEADLIIVGQRGGHGVAETLLGSTSERVARLSPIPLLIVPNGGKSSAEDVG